MNVELAAHILAKGKRLAPDRFPQPSQETAEVWAEALGSLDFPAALWSDAVTKWATELAGDRMVTPKDILHAAMLARNDWEKDAEKKAILEALRVERANRNYAKAGLEPITVADLPRHAGKPPEAVTERSGRQESTPQRLGDTKAFPFKRRSES